MIVLSSTARQDKNWRARGHCKYAPDLFFDIDTHGQAPEAKRVCRGCPVLPDCETWVADARPEFGVVAGMTPAERLQRFGRPVTAYHEPVNAEPKVQQGRHCRLCGQEFTPSKSRQRYCRPCGLHHPDNRVRAFYAGVPRCAS